MSCSIVNVAFISIELHFKLHSITRREELIPCHDNLMAALLTDCSFIHGSPTLETHNRYLWMKDEIHECYCWKCDIINAFVT